VHYVAQAAVRAALEGRVLVLEGVEKAERNVLPLLNNLLENREMALEDGSFLTSANRYDHLAATLPADRLRAAGLLRVHPGFVVVALGLPVPRYTAMERNANRYTVGIFGWERRPLISLDPMVPPYRGLRVRRWGLSIVQGPFSFAPRLTLTFRFANVASSLCYQVPGQPAGPAAAQSLPVPRRARRARVARRAACARSARRVHAALHRRGGCRGAPPSRPRPRACPAYAPRNPSPQFHAYRTRVMHHAASSHTLRFCPSRGHARDVVHPSRTVRHAHRSCNPSYADVAAATCAEGGWG
jgi:hypothetical protein